MPLIYARSVGTALYKHASQCQIRCFVYVYYRVKAGRYLICRYRYDIHIKVKVKERIVLREIHLQTTGRHLSIIIIIIIKQENKEWRIVKD